MAHSPSPKLARSFARLDTRCRCIHLFLLALSIGSYLAHANPLEDTPSVCKDRKKFKIRVDGKRVRYCDWVGEEDTEERCNTPYEKKVRKKKKKNNNGDKKERRKKKRNDNDDTEERRRKKRRNKNGDTREDDTEEGDTTEGDTTEDDTTEDDTKDRTKARRRKKKRNNNSDKKEKTKFLDARKLCTCTCADYLPEELDPEENLPEELDPEEKLCPDVMNDGVKNRNCLEDGYQQDQACKYNFVWNGCTAEKLTCMPVNLYTCDNEGKWIHRKNQIQFCPPPPRGRELPDPGTECQESVDLGRPDRDPSGEDSTGDDLLEELDPLEKLCPDETNDLFESRNCLENGYQKHQACEYNWVWSGCTLEQLMCIPVDSYTCNDEGEWNHSKGSIIQFCKEIRGIPGDELPEAGTGCQETVDDVARQRRRDPPSAEDNSAGDDLLQIRRR